MKLFSWNINGIRAGLNKGALQNLISIHQPDILCLQEIKAQDDGQIDLSFFSDYQIIWNSAQRKGYSGTMIMSRKPYLNLELNFSSNLETEFALADQYGNTNEEGRVLSVEFDNFYLVTVYTPNTKGDLSRLPLRHKAWDPAFLKHCQNLSTKKPVLMSGDFNVAHQEIDLARPKANVGKHGFTVEERQGFSNLMEAGFIDSFRHFYPDQEQAYTWWTHWGQARANNVGWRLDYWIVHQNFLNQLKSSQIHADIMGSDHCPVSIEIND